MAKELHKDAALVTRTRFQLVFDRLDSIVSPVESRVFLAIDRVVLFDAQLLEAGEEFAVRQAAQFRAP
jgi:hypothetical protein